MIKGVLERARLDGDGLTFGDVRLRTGYSEVMPKDVDVCGRFSRNVKLNVPIVSAAMDTVTEYKLAIELAKLGGIGIIHKNLTIEQQAKEVSRVKHHLNAFIETPISVSEDDAISDVLKMKKEKKYSFDSFPVLTRDGRLVGLITKNDFDFCQDFGLSVGSVMTKDLIVARVGTTPEEAYRIMMNNKRKILPLVDGDERLIGMYTWRDVDRIFRRSSESFNLDDRGQLIVGAAIGVGGEVYDRIDALQKANVNVVVIDTAHADSKAVIDTLKKIKADYPGLDVVVGNVSNGASVGRLIAAGADGIKVGQGPGSICTTRVVAGIGSPQVSAVYDCVRAMEEHCQESGQQRIPICADGGITMSGDIPIAIAAGADCVMLGSMLAGVSEAPGEVVYVDGRQWKTYRGMGSVSAMAANAGSRERYLQEDVGKDRLVPEGVMGRVPYKGKLGDILHQYVGGLRKGMGYVGAASIFELQEKGDFVRLTPAGLGESKSHNIIITEDLLIGVGL